MWNRKQNRIAELEARNAHLLANRPAPLADPTPSAETFLVRGLRADLRGAERRIDALNGAQGALEHRAVTAELARTELAYLIAEHIADDSSIETFRKRIYDLGHGEAVDRALKVITRPAAVLADTGTPGVEVPR